MYYVMEKITTLSLTLIITISTHTFTALNLVSPTINWLDHLPIKI